MVEALGRLGPPALPAASLLRDLMSHTNSHTSTLACIALARVEPENPDHTARLLGLLEESDRGSAMWVASELGKLSPPAPGAIPALRRVAENADRWQTRAMAATAAWRLDPTSTEPFAAITNELARTVPGQYEIVRMLGELGPGGNRQRPEHPADRLQQRWTAGHLMLRGGWLGKAGRIPNSLLRNNGNGTFTDVTEEAGLLSFRRTKTSVWFDDDGDGWLDFYLGTGNPDFMTLVPNRMFRNAGGKFFQHVTTATGTGHLQKGHAIAFVDLDHDGDQDLYADMGGAYPGDKARDTVFLNPGAGKGNRWLKLKLEGRQSNRAAIGARIKLMVETQEGARQICKTVNSGGSFGSSPLRQEIGLGAATTIDSVGVWWPATGRCNVSPTWSWIGPIASGKERPMPPRWPCHASDSI